MWFSRKKDKEKGGRRAREGEISGGPGGSHTGVRQQDRVSGQTGYASPPPGPPPGRRAPQHDGYAPPPGPPPGRGITEDYAPPSGPPPGRIVSDDFAPPSRPPPGQLLTDDYAPPPGPPPSWMDAPPPHPNAPLHDWQAAVPDTALFPPPPAIFSGFDASPANNATEQEAEAGEAWCAQYPLTGPITLDEAARGALHSRNIALVQPAGFSGQVRQLGPGHWAVQTRKASPDRCILGYPPLYCAGAAAAAAAAAGCPPRTTTIYYEVRVRAASGTANVALGFTALPYPSFRLPGWHRGSLAVHGDDGHRYVNDRWGGKAFTGPFAQGETYGVGMVLTRPGGAGGGGHVEVFFTREGTKVGRWDVHEETDAERDLGVFGLEGYHDLSCAIGCFEDVDLEVVFAPEGWKYVVKE